MNNMIRLSNYWINTLLPLCLLAIMGTGCSSSENSNSAISNDPTSDDRVTTSSLDGTWDLCGSLRNTYVFSGNNWEQYLAYFDNAECAGPPLTSEGLQPGDEPYASGTFELLDEVVTDSGVIARQLNMIPNTVDVLTRFDIVYTGTSDEMVFGTFAGFTEDERPVTLDFDAVYLRR